MSSSDDDEDLKLAIAMSLQLNPPAIPQTAVRSNEAIDLTSDTEDEDDDENLRRAIQLSLQEVDRKSHRDRTTVELSNVAKAVPSTSHQSKLLAQSDTAAPTASVGPLNFIGLDRKAMEQERLLRLGKRKRERSPDQPAKHLMHTSATEPSISSSIPDGSPKTEIIQYPMGTIKRTFAIRSPRANDITVDEVLQAESINIAVISSFMWDAECT